MSVSMTQKGDFCTPHTRLIPEPSRIPAIAADGASVASLHLLRRVFGTHTLFLLAVALSLSAGGIAFADKGAPGHSQGRKAGAPFSAVVFVEGPGGPGFAARLESVEERLLGWRSRPDRAGWA